MSTAVSGPHRHGLMGLMEAEHVPGKVFHPKNTASRSRGSAIES